MPKFLAIDVILLRQGNILIFIYDRLRLEDNSLGELQSLGVFLSSEMVT